jgi:hypothetical protein
MARRARFIDSTTLQALGSTGILNVQGISDPRFIVDALVVRNTITLAGAPAGTLGEADVGTTRIEALWKKLNTPFLNNVTFRTLDLWCKRQRLPSAHDYDVLADQTAAATAHSFDFVIPLRKSRAKRPDDYCVALDEIGQFAVQIPGTLSPVTGGMTLTSWGIEIYAIGRDAKAGEYTAGVLTRVDELTGDTGNDVDLRCYGHKVRDLFGYSVDPAASAISGNTNPRVEFDGREIVNLRGFNGSQTPYLWSDLTGADDYADFVVGGAYDNDLIEDLAPAAFLDKISEADQVRVAHVSYGARLTTPTDQRYCLETLYPSQSPAQLAQRVPGAGGVPAATMAEIAVTPSASGGRANVTQTAYFPAKIKV